MESPVLVHIFLTVGSLKFQEDVNLYIHEIMWLNEKNCLTSLCNFRFSIFNSSSTFSDVSAADLYRIT